MRKVQDDRAQEEKRLAAEIDALNPKEKRKHKGATAGRGTGEPATRKVRTVTSHQPSASGDASPIYSE